MKLALFTKALCVILFVLFNLSGCRERIEGANPVDVIIDVRVVSKNLPNEEADTTSGRMVYDGEKKLAYYLNNKKIGVDIEGGKRLLLELNKLQVTSKITVNNPPHEGYNVGRAVVSGIDEKYPIIQDPEIKKKVIDRLDELRKP